MRELTEAEASNLAYVVESGNDHALLETTFTILDKGYFDATKPVRAFLERKFLHTYDAQGQGPQNKVYLPAYVLDALGKLSPAMASLYRPQTKQGDPRIWFSRLHQYFKAGEILCVTENENALVVFSLSRQDIRNSASINPEWAKFLGAKVNSRAAVLDELLRELRLISSRGFLPSIKSGDTAIGHLLETELGIKQNSRKLPDFKGIEIKSSRAKFARAKTMFAKVPDWDLSPLKSSSEILENFGYFRDGKYRLNCSVSAAVVNSQGLSFNIDEDLALLTEISTKPNVPEVAVWKLDTLKTELANKHHETLWVNAESEFVNGREYLHFTKAAFTSQPLLSQFGALIGSGGVYMDHLISRDPNKKYASERGPLFKIRDSNFNQLFPRPVNYQF